MLSVFQFLYFVLFGSLLLEGGKPDASFDQNYIIKWGSDHVSSLQGGKEIQLSMDKTSGAGIMSKSSYGSGFFELDIKLPGKDSAGVVTAFYLHSESQIHDELDFEFLGNREGKPYYLSTNVFIAGKGGREQKFQLWFDPTADFHNYKILWNDHQVVFYVDKTPIRVYKKNTKIGVDYITQPLKIEGSLWDGDDWATEGGKAKINWTAAPFQAYFQNFDINGCKTDKGKMESCLSSSYWWNKNTFWTLGRVQQRAYNNARKNFMKYDYCTDRKRYPVPPPECSH